MELRHSRSRGVRRNDPSRDGGLRHGLTQSFAHDSDGQTANETTLLLRQPLPSGDVLSYRARRLALSGAISKAQNADVYGATCAAKPSDAPRFRSPPTSRNGAWHPSFVSASVACQPIDALRFVASLIQSAIETQLDLANRLHSKRVRIRRDRTSQRARQARRIGVRNTIFGRKSPCRVLR